jgi:site-specific DNA recombinase
MDEMRASIYARYSSDLQRPESIEDQVRQCREWIQSKDWILHEHNIFTDYAISGADANRPEYMRLKEAAQQREFDVIVVDDLSRLGRDMAESTKIFRDLNAIGASIISVSDGIDTSKPSGKLPYYLKGMMNEVFLDDMRAKIVRGLKGQVLRGYSAGGRVYAYTTTQILDPSGAKDKFGRPKRIGCEIQIDEAQAKVVREIFRMSVAGHGYRSIADHLNKRGTPSPHAGIGTRKGYWSRSTVKSILDQRKYLGDWTWNKTRWVNKMQGGKRIVHEKPQSEWVQYFNENLRIISDECWESAHPAKSQHRARRSGRRGTYPLSGVLKCDQCGSSLVVQNSGRYSAYVCNGYRNGGRSVCTNNHRVSRHVVERAFFQELKSILENPLVFAELEHRTMSALEARLKSGKHEFRVLQRSKCETERQINNLLGMVELGDVSQAISKRLIDRENQLLAVKAQLLRTSTEKPPTRRLINGWVKRNLDKLQDLLKSHSEYVTLFQQEIRNLFPDRLTVCQERSTQSVLFKISGKLYPLRSLNFPTSLMSHSGTGN